MIPLLPDAQQSNTAVRSAAMLGMILALSVYAASAQDKPVWSEQEKPIVEQLRSLR